jgi:DNA-binding XRE family transcriptional regulator
MQLNVRIIEIKGRRMALLPESQYRRLRERAAAPASESGLPPLPAKLPNGNYPALEYARASLARKIIRHRRRLGMSQAELARRAGVGIAYLNRLEKGNQNPTISTLEKIDAALKDAEKQSATV